MLDNYSELLFDKVHDKLKDEFPKIMKWEGLWVFSFVQGANLLKSSYLKTIAHLDANVREESMNAFVDCEHGSLGYSFTKLQKNKTQIIDEVLEDTTFNDPRGVVCNSDSEIKQEHAVFVLIKHEEKSLGMLDIFFSGEIDNTQLNEFRNYLNREFSEKDSELKQLCVSALKVKLFEDFLAIQDDKNPERFESDLKSKFKAAVIKIEKYISLTTVTPLFYLTDEEKRVSPDLIGLNFDFIQKLIAYEYRFCALTSQKECYYNTCNSPTPNYTCHNDFLESYFIRVIQQLGHEVKDHPFTFNSSSYRIEVIDHSKEFLGFDNLITDIVRDNYEKINAKLNEFKVQYEKVNEIAILKLQDELWFSVFSKKLGGALVLVLYREVDRHLKCVDFDCIDRNDVFISNNSSIAQVISPSNLLHLQYKDQPSATYFFKEHDKKINVVGFKIINEESFLQKLKELIANQPEFFSEKLLPYIKGEKTHILNMDGINLHYTGVNPLSDNNYKSLINEQINLIAGLLQTKKTLGFARKAAISQVMARNMSHNHGSHVLSRMIHSDHIKDLLSRHEGIRCILLEKIK